MTNLWDKSPKTTISDNVEAEALAWIAQLDGDNISEKDLDAFREWVSRSPAHASEIRKLNLFWDELNILTNMAEPIAQADALSRQLRRESTRKWRYGMGGMVAVAMLAGIFILPVFYRQNVPDQQPIETTSVQIPKIYKAEIGEQQTHTLPDGTVVILNTDSHIEVDFLEDQRRVRLLHGEVLFDVTHDPTRPFLVFAGDGIVRAVGTAFSVRLNGDRVDVVVSKGSVELSSVRPESTKKMINDTLKIASIGIVKAGNAAQIENLSATIETMTENDIRAKLSWQNGLITFRGETLEEVIQEISRYTELDIQLRNPELKNLRLGGVFKSGDLDGLYAILKTNFGISTTIVDNKVILDR